MIGKAYYFKKGIQYGRNSGVNGLKPFINRYKVIGIKYDKFRGL